MKMPIVNFDEHFAEYVSEWMKAHQSEYSNFDEMEKAVEFIENEEIASQEELQAVIGKIKALLGLGRFALVDGDNIVYTQYTSYTGRSRHAFPGRGHNQEPDHQHGFCLRLI
jgi:hypothetical protein